MADEYVVNWLGAEVLLDSGSSVNVVNLTAEALVNYKEVNVAGLYVEVLRTLDDVPEFPVQLPLPSEIAELNPYRPDIPTEIEEKSQILYYYMREVAETLRKQHNLIQVGDTTYPWTVLTDFDLEPRYTLGSVGRFYHSEYGMIHARYVKFDKIVDTEWIGAPAGSLLVSDSVDWIVTNDFTQSSPDLVQGFIGGYRLPVNGEYGWVIINGINPQELQIVETWSQGDTLVWAGTGLVSRFGVGKSLGHIWGRPAEYLIPGIFYVNLGGYGVEAIRSALEEDFAEFESSLAELTARLEALEDSADFDGVVARVASLEVSRTSLTQQLNIEIIRRQQGDQQLNARIDSIITTGFVSQAEFTTYQFDVDARFDVLEGYVNTQIPSISNSLNSLTNNFNSFVSATNLTLTNLNTIAMNLLNRVSALEATNKVWVPLTVGSPPVLVYDANDELILIERVF